MGKEKLKRSLGMGIFSQINRFSGALKSGNPAARLGIFIKGIGFFTRLIDKMNYHALGDSKDKNGTIPPCLMIVSPPRSGSTIAYQVLIRAIRCVYISNLHSLFPNYASSYLLRNKLFGTNLGKFGEFHNYYGYTSSIYDVNEGNEIIEEIFDDNADKGLIRKRFVTFAGVMRANQERPLIFKNVRAYPHIANLHKAVPEIIFLRIKRDPEQIIQSVVRAYHELGTFHPISQALVNYEINDPLEFAVRQFLEIEREIDFQKEQIEQTKWIEWWYEDFCSDPWPMILNLVGNYFQMDQSHLRRNAVPKLRVSKRVKVSEAEANRISLLLRQYVNLE